MENELKHSGADAEHNRRPSSYHMQDGGRVFELLRLREGHTFLDIGCGAGDYTRHAVKVVGAGGAVCSLDKSEAMITDLRRELSSEGITNITLHAADITEALPVESESIDVGLLATVLHVPQVFEKASGLMEEVCRVLKPGGVIGIIDCSSKDLSFGPPAAMRISPAQIEGLMLPLHFRKTDEADFGFNYMLLYEKMHP